MLSGKQAVWVEPNETKALQREIEEEKQVPQKARKESF